MRLVNLQSSLGFYSANRPRRTDLIIFYKERGECQIIDFVLPFDTRVDGEEV